MSTIEPEKRFMYLNMTFESDRDKEFYAKGYERGMADADKRHREYHIRNDL